MASKSKNGIEKTLKYSENGIGNT